MASSLSAVLLPALFFFLFFLQVCNANDKQNEHATERFKFLYFGSITGGCHQNVISKSGRVLAQRGHHVVSLITSSSTDNWQRDADLFSFVVFNSSYTKQNRSDVMDNISKVVLKGRVNSFWGPFIAGAGGNLTGRLNILTMWLQECDDLFGDSATMKRLNEEGFDMLVVDDQMPCGPLLAQALDIPFIHHSVFFVIPSKHGYWTGIPTDPSYIPERALGLTDKMTFLQRVKNVLALYFYGFVHFRWGICNYDGYDKLKIKYNIKPEISTFESYKQAVLYIVHGSFGLEFPRPMQPNTINVLHVVESGSNKTIEDDVAKFLDTAPAGVVLFSLGTFVTSCEPEQAQLFADAFAMLPHRVLWQAKLNFDGIELGNNTMVAKWLPLAHVMEHAKVKMYVSHAAAFSLYEALWAGLPVVGLPLFEDQMDLMVRVESQGAGMALDIGIVTPETLSQTIRTVMNEPRFRSNAQRISKILRDLHTSSNHEDTVARWILHVTRFGGDHLRPAVQELNFLQKSLLDVYLFISVVLALIIGVNVSVCYFCCRCMCNKGKKTHSKQE